MPVVCGLADGRVRSRSPLDRHFMHTCCHTHRHTREPQSLQWKRSILDPRRALRKHWLTNCYRIRLSALDYMGHSFRGSESEVCGRVFAPLIRPAGWGVKPSTTQRCISQYWSILCGNNQTGILVTLCARCETWYIPRECSWVEITGERERDLQPSINYDKNNVYTDGLAPRGILAVVKTSHFATTRWAEKITAV